MAVTIAVVIAIIVLQIFKFAQNRRRISLFSKIFEGKDYEYIKNPQEFIVGISGPDNEIFKDIENSINGYLDGTQGTDVDFQLLKDTIDRHCDMVEDEINSQMPLPLYFGLAGTMAGAIIGLISLVWNGALLNLMADTSSTASAVSNSVATNINDLLWGVAIAMVASVFGIILTSWNTIYFKDRKLREETGKNRFLAWMQARVLSAVPSGVSQQMKALVNQLAMFNRNFKANTDEINVTLSQAKEIYKSQAEVISKYEDIDLDNIARGVTKIMKQLGNSTQSLEDFTLYLNIVRDYYSQMQVFAEKLNKESERIGILQDIQTFFQSHKGVIAEETSEAHKDIQQSVKAIQQATEKQVSETYTALTEQSQKLRDALNENNEQFSILCQEMRDKFREQMEELPSIAQNLKRLEDLPNRLEAAISKIAQSQNHLADHFQRASQSLANRATERNYPTTTDAPQQSAPQTQMPEAMKWTVIIGIILMTAATITNTVYNICKDDTPAVIVDDSDSTPADAIQQEGDSIHASEPQHVTIR